MNNNLQTIHRVYEAFGKGDIPAIIEFLADDIQWEQWADNTAQKENVPWLLARQGKEGAIEFFKSLANLEIVDFRVLSIMSNDNQVAVEFILEANVPSTGNHYRDEEMHLWTFNAEGKVTRLRHYTDTAKHIAAAKNKK